MVDKLVAQTQETLKSVLHDKNHNECDLDYASKVIRDAENSKHVSIWLLSQQKLCILNPVGSAEVYIFKKETKNC